jgi:hypothetical protein
MLHALPTSAVIENKYASMLQQFVKKWEEKVRCPSGAAHPTRQPCTSHLNGATSSVPYPASVQIEKGQEMPEGTLKPAWHSLLTEAQDIARVGSARNGRTKACLPHGPAHAAARSAHHHPLSSLTDA